MRLRLLNIQSGRLVACLKLVALLSLCTVLSGCNYLLFDPKGPIGEEQKWLIIMSFLVMMIVVIPVFFMTIYFAFKYRSSNKSNEYLPNWEHSNKIEAVVWIVPCLIIIWLGIITYQTSYSLDPRQPIKSDKDVMRVHVVALDWKWLFIYPEQEIASVNELAMPVNVPVEFLITSDSVMNSFFMPQIGSQIYAMAGMENQLNLVADTEGVYRGYSANYSGFGFSGMKFKAHVISEEGFNEWVDKVKSFGIPLSDERYLVLKEKSKDHPVEYFSPANPLMFNNIIESYTGIQNGK